MEIAQLKKIQTNLKHVALFNGNTLVAALGVEKVWALKMTCEHLLMQTFVKRALSKNTVITDL